MEGAAGVEGLEGVEGGAGSSCLGRFDGVVKETSGFWEASASSDLILLFEVDAGEDSTSTENIKEKV